MRKLIAIAAALLLAACATPPQQPVPIVAKSSSGIIVAGTLSLGPCDMSLAAQYTRATVVLQKAAQRVGYGRMTPDRGKLIADKGARLIETLDSICQLESDGSMGDAFDARDRAAQQLPELEILLGDPR